MTAWAMTYITSEPPSSSLTAAILSARAFLQVIYTAGPHSSQLTPSLPLAAPLAAEQGPHG